MFVAGVEVANVELRASGARVAVAAREHENAVLSVMAAPLEGLLGRRYLWRLYLHLLWLLQLFGR